MRNADFWDVTPCAVKDISFANIVPSSAILVTLMMEAMYVPLKHQFLQEPYGITSQKTTFFMVTTLKPQMIHVL
jgi:hypothetical protein